MPSERSSRSSRRAEDALREERDADKARAERDAHRSNRTSSSARNERKRKRDVDTSDDTAAQPSGQSPTRKERREDGEASPGPAEAASGGNDIALSVDETNKLREKLGLKPLEVDSGPKVVDSEDGKPGDKQVTEDGKVFTHRAPGNWGDDRKEASVREKLAAAKEKRRLMAKVGGKGGLADEDDEDAASWVEKMRRKEEERKKAEERAKALEEMDEEFGVGDLIQKEAAKRRPKPKRPAQPKGPGFTVAHSASEFMDGSSTVLVLKDKGVLDDDDEETLINPTMAEHEHWKRNTEIRKKKPGYNPYDDIVDEDGNLKQKGVLDKYNDDVLDNDGLAPKETFKITESGDADLGPEARAAEIRAKLREAKAATASSLDMGKYQLAREYYTEEEMIAFKRPKKKKDKQGMRKKEKKVRVKVEDLQPQAHDDQDFGSRERGRGRAWKKTKQGEEEESSDDDAKPAQGDPGLPLLPAAEAPSDSDDDDLYGPTDGLALEDEAEEELASVLQKARRLNTNKFKTEGDTDASAERVAKALSTLPKVKDEPQDDEDEDKAQITLDATTEYCRGLGDIPTLPSAAPRQLSVSPEPETQKKKRRKWQEEMSGGEEEPMEEEEEEEEGESVAGTSSKWVSVSGKDESRRKERKRVKAEAEERRKREEGGGESSESETEILGKEESAGASVAAAIKLAAAKGYLDGAKKAGQGTGPRAELVCKRKSVVQQSSRDDDKYTRKLERMGMGGGPTRSFDDKRDYEPNVRLNYCDEKGRQMSTKEAFRYQSWKFHGKFPGKMKTEKRRLKLKEKEKVSQMESTDTPLGTLSKQIRKQENTGLHFIQLSGQNKELVLPKD